MPTGKTSDTAQTETSLIGRCKRINEKLEKALEITIEITGQRYDESKLSESDSLGTSDTMNDLLVQLQVMSLKAENLMTQLDHIRGRF